MENFDLSSLKRYDTPKISNYIAVIGKVTRVMNLRILKKNNDDARYPYSSNFQCGVDIIPLANGGHIIITTLGFYAFTFEEFATRFLEYERRKLKENERYMRHFNYNPLAGLGFIFTDDTDALSTPGEDEDGNLIYEDVEPQYIQDEKIMKGIHQYDSTEQFVEAIKNNNTKLR